MRVPILPEKCRDKGRWWQFAWSLVDGCTRVSAGCDHCWSREMFKRYKKPGKFGDVKFRADRLEIPLKRKKPAVYAIWNDLFHIKVKLSETATAWDMMERCPQHRFLILTKRADDMQCCVKWMEDDGQRVILPNVGLGVSVESQETADERIPLLLKTPAAFRFVNYGPALKPVNFAQRDGPSFLCTYDGPLGDCHSPCDPCEDFETCSDRALDWVIAEGESGSGHRADDPAWYRDVRDECQHYQTPFWLKQLAGRRSIPSDLLIRQVPRFLMGEVFKNDTMITTHKGVMTMEYTKCDSCDRMIVDGEFRCRMSQAPIPNSTCGDRYCDWDLCRECYQRVVHVLRLGERGE